MLAVRKALGVLVSLIALAGVLVTVVLATRRIDLRPRTDDGYLQADLVHMAPDVSGRIVELDVRDNQAAAGTSPRQLEFGCVIDAGSRGSASAMPMGPAPGLIQSMSSSRVRARHTLCSRGWTRSSRAADCSSR